MLDEDLRVSLPTEEELPYSDEKPVDSELQLLAGFLLRGILNHIWSDRFDWLFAVNLGIYPDPYEPAIAPDAFLSLGVERVRENNKLRLSYLLYQEKVMPQWVLEVVSKKPGGEYSTKFRRYAEMGVLYYVIYNPSHYRRDKHEMFEVYRLEKGKYILQVGNPVWMPEIGLGIGHEKSHQEGVNRDWLFWYNEEGDRYLPPGDALEQEKILRGREKLIRRSLEDQLEQQRLESASRLEQERLESASRLEQAHRSLALRMIQENMPLETIARITNLTIEQLEQIR
ncbi:MAG: Uma2 family endonuclease [Cyanobacteria bacterium]|nr:Uma2 family endonuclease [Cyanobacteriota bacterium]